MGSNKRDLKAYVRFDGSGRVVPGSLVLRRKMPKVGKWQEIVGYECCNPTTTTTTTPTVEPLTLTVNPFCDYEPNDHGVKYIASGGVRINGTDYEYSNNYYESEQDALNETSFNSLDYSQEFLIYLNNQDFGKTLWVSVRDSQGTVVAASWTDTCQLP